MYTLAIESSCDETSASILDNNKVLSNIISSQLFHKDYGGIVPELASRAHIRSIDTIVGKAFSEAGIERSRIDIVAATRGPGLIGSLLVGYNYARSFSIAVKKPFVAVNHIESHLFSCFIGNEDVEFPFIALVVSGGHTILFHVKGYDDHEVLGSTQDDAAGEAFDKAAKMLGLDYPGGPLIDEFAKSGNENFHKFPVSSVKENIYDFSFSGVKTSLLYFLRKEFSGTPSESLPLNDICASYQKAVVASLVNKTMLASENLGIKSIAVSGGVSANSKLRSEFMKYKGNGYRIFFPLKIYSTDNAAMIGYIAYLKYRNSPELKFKNDIFENAFARFEF